jgi:hypothetical protein
MGSAAGLDNDAYRVAVHEESLVERLFTDLHALWALVLFVVITALGDSDLGIGILVHQPVFIGDAP